MTLIGQTIREYKVLKKLGEGGAGTVYMAHQEKVDRDVAIKVISASRSKDDHAIEQFISEAKVIAKLEDPHIVPLYDYWVDEQGVFLVMRYISGGSLYDMMQRREALSLPTTMRIMNQICAALDTSHEAGIIHRDLKPANILIDDKGNAYLSDFGIAKPQSDETVENPEIAGTFGYLSPEQIESGKAMPQSDIYALGIMLFEMLRGQHPFYGATTTQLLLKHLNDPVPLLSTARTDLPVEIDNVIQQATEKRPDIRFSSAGELYQMLEAVYYQNATTPPPMPSPTPSRLQITQRFTIPQRYRNRYALLKNVRRYWIEGVLDNALHNAMYVALGMKAETDAINDPWDTVLRRTDYEQDETLPAHTDIISVYEDMNGKMLILGDPGSGKTTTLLELTRELLEIAEQDNEHPVPVIFNLSSWSEDRLPLVEWIQTELSNRYQVPNRVAKKWVEEENIILLLDGLDEVDAAYRNDCLEAINAYRLEYGFVDIIVCSRLKDYEELTGRLSLNGAITLQPMTNEQIEAYLAKLGTEVATLRELMQQDNDLREMARSPLMLNIMSLAYRGTSVQGVANDNLTVEEQRDLIFGMYVDRMFERYTTENTPYVTDDMRQYLGWLGYQMQQHKQSLFQIEDLQPNWLGTGWLNRNKYVWTAASLQMFGMFFGVYLYILMAAFRNGYLLMGKPVQASILTNILPIVLSLSVVAFIYILIPTYLNNIESVERIMWSPKAAFRPRRFVVAVGVIGPLIAIWIGLSSYLLDEANNRGIIDVAVLLTLLVMAAGGFVSTNVSTKTRPNEGMYRSLSNTLQLTIVYSLVAGLAFLLSRVDLILTDYTVWISVLGILSSSIGFVLVVPFLSEPFARGGNMVVRHVALRLLLTRRKSIPLNLARMLDYGVSLALMRRVGGGYIFIHRYLLEYFAKQHVPYQSEKREDTQ